MSFPWTNSDGEACLAQEWPCEEPRAIVACLHGMSGAAEQFAPLAGKIGPVSLYAADLRGQGCDPQPSRRGARLDLATQHRDVEAFLKALRNRHPGLPLFLAGESMGALISGSYAALHHDIAGLILSVPVVDLRRPVPFFVPHALRLIARVAPSLRCRPSLFVNGKTLAPPLTRDTAYQDAMRSKPHYISNFSFRFLSELGDLIRASAGHAAALHLPVLVLAAGNDCFVTTQQIEKWFEKIPSPDKTLKIYPDAYHLLWHDWDKDQVAGDIRDWLARHI